MSRGTFWEHRRVEAWPSQRRQVWVSVWSKTLTVWLPERRDNTEQTDVQWCWRVVPLREVSQQGLTGVRRPRPARWKTPNYPNLQSVTEARTIFHKTSNFFSLCKNPHRVLRIILKWYIMEKRNPHNAKKYPAGKTPHRDWYGNRRVSYKNTRMGY